jgi:hypothetical protein
MTPSSPTLPFTATTTPVTSCPILACTFSPPNAIRPDSSSKINPSSYTNRSGLFVLTHCGRYVVRQVRLPW